MKLVKYTKRTFSILLALYLAYGSTVIADEKYSDDDDSAEEEYSETVVFGFPTHGTNNYYGEFIHDYSEDTNYPLLVDGPWYQVGLLNPDGPREELPVAGDDLDRPLATTSDMVENFIAPGLYDPFDPIFNKPFNALGTLFFGSQGLYDRVPVVPHEVCNPTVFDVSYCTREGAIQNPTLGQWNRIQARLVIKHKPDGSDDIQVVVRRALPQTIFSIWLVGVTDNFEPNPMLTATPLGGIPNVIVTDKDGSGEARVSVNVPILKPCERGVGKGCQLYVSLVWHPDGVVFGGTPSVDFISDPAVPGTPGLPVGVIGSAQAFIPLQGKPLFDAQQVYLENW